jgi:hypothetical protein
MISAAEEQGLITPGKTLLVSFSDRLEVVFGFEDDSCSGSVGGRAQVGLGPAVVVTLEQGILEQGRAELGLG